MAGIAREVVVAVDREASGAVPLASYASGTWTEVLEAQRSSTIEQIVVHQGVPMGPAGAMGPTGPTGAKGESTEWSLGPGLPPEPTAESEIGEIWLDTDTGRVYVLTSTGWEYRGNLIGPTGATGPIGEPIQVRVASVFPGAYGEASVDVEEDPAPPHWALHFVVPSGATGPVGPPPTVAVGNVDSVGPDEPPKVDVASSNGAVQLDFWLQQGPTGPAGTNIRIVGELAVPGPPTAVGAADGDGYVDSADHVWVWSDVAGAWIDVGPVVGPQGPTGPTGAGFRPLEFDLAFTDQGDGTAVQVVTHSLPNPYPLARVLLDQGDGTLMDAQSVSVAYVSATEIRVIVDAAAADGQGKVVVM